MGCNLSFPSILSLPAMGEWFEDLSSEEEERVVTEKSGKKRLAGNRISAKLLSTIDTIDVIVAVNHLSQYKVVSCPSLMATVPCSLLSKLELKQEGAVGILCLARGTQMKKQSFAKSAVRSWRDRPVRASPCGAFRGTLPGELSRDIIAARVESGRFSSVMDRVNSTSLGGEALIVDKAQGGVCNFKRDTKKIVKDARDMIGKGRASKVRKHHTLCSLPSHAQVGNVIVPA